jgi:hypothetical protein
VPDHTDRLALLEELTGEVDSSGTVLKKSSGLATPPGSIRPS